MEQTVKMLIYKLLDSSALTRVLGKLRDQNKDAVGERGSRW